MGDAASLIIAPAPLADESPASWLFRLCSVHGIGYIQILSAFGLGTPADPDVRLPATAYRTLVRGTDISTHRVGHFDRIYQHVRPAKFRSLLAFDGQGRPSYRFCTECFLTDRTPYLRIAWRFVDWDFCPIHFVRLSYSCSECDTPLQPIYRVGERVLVTGESSSLAQCVQCGAPLTLNPKPERLKAERALQVVSTQRALISSFLHGYAGIVGYEPLLSIEELIWVKNWLRLEGIVDQVALPSRRKAAYLGRVMKYLKRVDQAMRMRPDVSRPALPSFATQYLLSLEESESYLQPTQDTIRPPPKEFAAVDISSSMENEQHAWGFN